MRLLLFFISILFSGIFYVFSQFNNGLNIFGDKLEIHNFLQSFSGNLIIETFVFLFLAVFFLIYFGPVGNSKNTLIEDKYNIFYVFFYTIFIIAFLFPFFEKGFFINTTILFFLFGDVCFSIISNIKSLKEQKLNLRYFGIFLNYLSVLISMYYVYNIGASIFLILILAYSSFFNYFIHKKYTNYISLFLSILILIFLLYFFLLQIYSYLVKIF